MKGKPGRKPTSTFAESIVVPSIPEGETPETMDNMQKELKDPCKSGSGDYDKVHQLMTSTFPHRRKEVLTENVRVW